MTPPRAIKIGEESLAEFLVRALRPSRTAANALKGRRAPIAKLLLLLP